MNKRTQSGLSMWGWMYVIATLVMLGAMGMKGGPVYLNDVSIKGIMEKVAADPSAGSASPADLRGSIDKYCDTSYVKYVTGADVKIKANPKGGRMMELKYEVRIPMFYNVDAIFRFEHLVALPNPA